MVTTYLPLNMNFTGWHIFFVITWKLPTGLVH